MPLEARLLVGLTVAVSVVLAATPLAIRVADRLDLYDRPAAHKGHAAPTPYLGGAAVVAGFVLALLLAGDASRTLPLLGGVLVLWALGTADDVRPVGPGWRVAVEAALGLLLWEAGLGWDLGGAAEVDAVITAAWVVAVVNAFNLFDNMDGAATTMAGVAAAALAVLGIAEGDTWLAVAAAALAGACLGFLRHNLLVSPARIFLGDGGSLPIGFAVAALAMAGTAGAAPAWQSLAMGVLLVGVPALDTALVVVSRARRGVSLLHGGQDHLTHRTRRRVRTTRAVALVLGGAQAAISALAIVALERGSIAIALAVAAYVAATASAIAVLDRPVAVRADPIRWAGLAVPAGAAGFAVLVAVGPFAHGYYDSALWVPAALVLVAAVAAAAVARPVSFGRPAVVALAALGGLASWALLSTAWADSAEQALVEGDRLVGYALALGALVLVVRSERAAAWLTGAAGAAGAAVAVVVLARMLGHDPAAAFLGGRLHEPLGYINGQAAFFGLALWPCLAAAEQRRSTLLAGAGAGVAALLACMLVLGQSRGALLGLAVGIAVVLAVLPGRVRRAWALVVVGGGVAAALPALLPVYDEGSVAPLADATVRSAGRAALLVALGVGVAWAVLHRVAATPAPRMRTAAVGGLATIAGAGLAVAAVQAGDLAQTVDRQASAFVRLDAEGGADRTSSRLVSGSGNRHDYWRVAWDAWRDRPVGGLGAGGYDAAWFEHRRVLEDVRQPHSLPLQVLSELGIVGLALLLAVLGGVGWAVARARRHAGVLAVAATGAVTAWAVHAGVDWIHLLPGVTVLALAAAAVLLRGGPGPAVAAGPRRGARALLAVPLAIALVAAAVLLARQGLSEHYRRGAQDALAASPARALEQADRALRLAPESVTAYRVKAAALARFDEPAAARAALVEATRREPRDFVTWALLGDLAVRTGDEAGARRAYERAAALNPRDPGVRP